MKRIVLFQLEGFHEEVIPSFAESCINCSIPFKIYTNKNAFISKGNIFEESIYKKELNNNTEFHSGEDQPKMIESYLEKIISFNPTCVIFLTFYSDCIMEIAKELSFKNIKTFALIHNTNKTFAINKAFNLLSKNQVNPIFLSKHVKDSYLRELDLRDLNLKNQEISKNVFYNVFTPDKRDIFKNNINELNITICGSINLLNFDYYDLIDFIKKYKKNNNSLKLKITIPAGGRSRDEVINYVNKNDLEDYFFFPKLNKYNRCFYSDYYGYVRSADFIICLKRIKIGARLEDKRITSTVPTGLSFSKPFICNNKVASLYSIESCSIIGKDINEQFKNILYLYKKGMLIAKKNKFKKNLEEFCESLKLQNSEVLKEMIE